MCDRCDIHIDEDYRPDTNSFRKYISYFVQDIPDPTCAKSGRAAYLDVKNYFCISSIFFPLISFFVFF